MKNKTRIPRNVMVLSIVSFFNDVASEMIYPIVPLFLTSVMGAPVSVVGLIEGIAEATASLMKFVSGYVSDLMHRRKPFVVAGYALGAVSKVLIGLAHVWPFVLFARIIDRLGKGVRTSARDSLLLQNTTPDNKGYIFGFHRSVDSLGAVFGPLIALVLMYVLKENMRMTFFIAFIPAVVGVLLLIFLVREKKESPLRAAKIKKAAIGWKSLSPSLKLFFVISILFALGNSSDAFLILRSKQIGLTTTMTVFAYVLYNIVQTVFSTPGGRLADKIGARKVFAMGLAAFAVVYGAFAFISSPAMVWIMFPIYGVYIAFTDGVSKAYIAEFITERESGTFFGLYQTGTAIASFVASFVGGLLWSRFGSYATFGYGAFMALAALAVLGYGKAKRHL